MPLSLFCRILSDKYDIGMVFSHDLAERQITAEFKRTDLQSVLNVVSRQIGVDIVRVGNTYFIGALRPEDRGVLVRRIMGYDQQSLNSIVTPMLSQTGKAQVMSNGVLVATDHESVLRRLVEMCDYLDTVYPGSWIVQLYFVSLRKDAMLEAGFDTKSSGSISYDIANSKIDLNDIKLEGLFSFGANSNFTDVFAAPMMVIRDGSTGSWRDGERVPIPKKTVSNEGTVSTTGFEYIDTGFILNATVRESRRGGIIKLDITQSQIKSYVEYSPVTAETKFTLECDLVPGKIYLLGELSTFKLIDQQQNVAVFSADRGKTSMQIWCKLYRVSEPIKENYPHADRFSAAPAGAPENDSACE
ncbi:MAG: hypothetical protein HPZ91_00645 [Lentisphaeria bacterium]|nr:hypothetical protein [Lentisphaeria bacterium]